MVCHQILDREIHWYTFPRHRPRVLWMWRKRPRTMYLLWRLKIRLPPLAGVRWVGSLPLNCKSRLKRYKHQVVLWRQVAFGMQPLADVGSCLKREKERVHPHWHIEPTSMAAISRTFVLVVSCEVIENWKSPCAEEEESIVDYYGVWGWNLLGLAFYGSSSSRCWRRAEAKLSS